MPEEFAEKTAPALSKPLIDYLLTGLPLPKEHLIELGHNPDGLAYQMTFVASDFDIANRPNHQAIEGRIELMKRFAGQAATMGYHQNVEWLTPVPVAGSHGRNRPIPEQ